MGTWHCSKCDKKYESVWALCPTCGSATGQKSAPKLSSSANVQHSQQGKVTPTTKPQPVSLQLGQQVRVTPTPKPPPVNLQQKQTTQNVDLTAKSSPLVMAQRNQLALSTKQNVKSANEWLCAKCNKSYQSTWGTGLCPTCGKVGQKLSATQTTLNVQQNVETEPSGLASASDEVLKLLFTYLDETTLGLMELLCSRYKRLAKSVLAELVPAMWAYGSGTSGKGGIWGQLRKHIDNATRSIVLAVDKFPCAKTFNGSILAYILAKKIPLDISLGTPDVNTLQILNNAQKNSARAITTFTKMHNKIWVIDGEGVILGSPNVSYSGLICGNLESCIVIKSRRLGHLVGNYLELLKKPNPWKDEKWTEVENELALYNQSSKLKMALAPITDISDFVVENLQDATKIILRQFLVSDRAKYLLSALCNMAKKGAEIEVYIDAGAYKGFDFVQKAVTQLIEAGVAVYTQTPVLVVDTSQERIQHDKLILAELRSGVCRTLIGSAGFT
ncbi:MAG TPA: phospholipase D-like domain-containing protein, partial [Thermoanaerobaculia bacterium]